MGTVAKAGAIIIAAALTLYVVGFLVALPMMAKAPTLPHKIGVNLYAALYKPARDALPPGNFIVIMIRDYESYWCGGSSRCEL